MEEAAAEKARLPTVESLTDGTMRRLVAAERRVRRPGTSATRVSGPRYRGALPSFRFIIFHFSYGDSEGSS